MKTRDYDGHRKPQTVTRLTLRLAHSISQAWIVSSISQLPLRYLLRYTLSIPRQDHRFPLAQNVIQHLQRLSNFRLGCSVVQSILYFLNYVLKHD